MATGTIVNSTLAEELLEAFDEVFGLHPGFRPAHAKGAMCTGTFTPSPQAATLTRAPHATRPSTPITMRFSDSTGLPNIPDNDPQSSPNGMAVRFHLGDHDHTDIIAHSADGFPVRTGEEFLNLLRAAAAAQSGDSALIQTFMAAHPLAKQFAETARPIPTSFARETFFAVTAFTFTNADGVERHGRFRIRPTAGTEYLSDQVASTKSANFLFDEIEARLAREPAVFGVFVQLAESGDDVANAAVAWPTTRTEMPFGTITISSMADDLTPDLRKIIFDPVPRLDGIGPSADPLIEVRSDLYLLSGRRRRAAKSPRP
jgi:catalase